MDKTYLMSAVEAILFAAGDPVPAQRIALVLGVKAAEVFSAAEALAREYLERGSGLRLLRLDEKLQLCSAPEQAENITRALEQRKQPKLTPAAMPSGRSVVSRITRTGLPKLGASSCTPPESVKIIYASLINFTNGRYDCGSINRTLPNPQRIRLTGPWTFGFR